jgi:hypothetical protein
MGRTEYDWNVIVENEDGDEIYNSGFGVHYTEEEAYQDDSETRNQFELSAEAGAPTFDEAISERSPQHAKGQRQSARRTFTVIPCPPTNQDQRFGGLGQLPKRGAVHQRPLVKL